MDSWSAKLTSGGQKAIPFRGCKIDSQMPKIESTGIKINSYVLAKSRISDV